MPPSIQHQVILQDEIRTLIPHGGAMCLLERVLDWNERSIRCATRSHLADENPLRMQGSLRAVSAVEYAAQAMALHGALTCAADQRAGAGYLVSLRDVCCNAAPLDEIADELWVEAERVLGSGTSVTYAFRVGVAERPLVTGRATVILGPARQPDQRPANSR